MTDSDQKMQDLQTRVKALEIGAAHDATKEAVQKAQADMLAKMREIRESMKAGAAGTASTKELDALKTENKRLQEQNAKQAYRIQHLVGTVEKLLAEAK